MKIEDIKTIDINALEWFDKINGNSYFSATIILNYSLENELILKIPFRYGYGDAYYFESFKAIEKYFNIDIPSSYWSYCKDKNIIVRTNKKENCLKRELLNNG